MRKKIQKVHKTAKQCSNIISFLDLKLKKMFAKIQMTNRFLLVLFTMISAEVDFSASY